ncbi:MAG: TRIC cation channel family protein [Clostridia bacterium]|jgi:uncharacterized membrane protein YeiH|nr:TRIC cation channel family protein [Clostridia bacterium]MBR5365274.1 TRIC cation channel family protein [Clostridia bacterium]MBR5680474.1 TRIC cation channel family protein [Clostridia bacterium]MCR5680829.1 TRIC cation channel family protein [Clostridiales bacterium]
MTFDTFVFIIELISITSFGISGAITAIKKNMDIFGVIIVGVTTAIGGGVIRDMLLGIHPPKTFVRPVYALVSASFSLLAFLIEYRHAKRHTPGEPFKGRFTETALFWLDTTGLAIFTMVGVAVAYEHNPAEGAFVVCFVGVLTGVGGGVLRDLLCQNMPYIFVKHFYASACVVGAVAGVLLWNPAGKVAAMLTGTGVIMLLRFLAARFRWNLPRVPTM